jgi:hypothetical protein
MENLKKANTAPLQLKLSFGIEVIGQLAPTEQREVTLALIGLLIEASGLTQEPDDER